MPSISFTKKEIDYLVQEFGALAEFADEQNGDKPKLIKSIQQKVLSAYHKGGLTKRAADLLRAAVSESKVKAATSG